VKSLDLWEDIELAQVREDVGRGCEMLGECGYSIVEDMA